MARKNFFQSLSVHELSLLIFPNRNGYFSGLAAAAAKLLQSCPTLWDSIDGSAPSSPFPGILQARTPEWVAISFSNAGKWKVKVKSLSRVRLLVTPGTAAYQAPPSMGFSRQEDWSGVPLPSPFQDLLYIKILATTSCISTPFLNISNYCTSQWILKFMNIKILQ